MNEQIPVKKYNTPNKHLTVHSIFKTIQGEGVLVGTPSIFLRLYGCNLQCPLCDTDYTSVKDILHEDTIVSQIKNISGNIKTVVITGGEPFNQPLGGLIDKLHSEDFIVQIETNGTLYQEDIDYSKCIIVCSPKTHYVHPELRKYVHSYKYVGGKELQLDGLPKTVLGFNTRKEVFRPKEDSIIYLQPLDEKCESKNRDNLKSIVESCINNNYRLCLQTHKIIGVE